MKTIKPLGNMVKIADTLDDDKQLLLLVKDSEGHRIDAFLNLSEAEALRAHLEKMLEAAKPIPGAWTGWPVQLAEPYITSEGITLPGGFRGHCVGDQGGELIDVRFRASGPALTFKRLDRSAFRLWGVT